MNSLVKACFFAHFPQPWTTKVAGKLEFLEILLEFRHYLLEFFPRRCLNIIMLLPFNFVQVVTLLFYYCKIYTSTTIVYQKLLVFLSFAKNYLSLEKFCLSFGKFLLEFPKNSLEFWRRQRKNKPVLLPLRKNRDF